MNGQRNCQRLLRQHRLALCGSDFLEWLPEQTERFIRKYRMFTREERILVAPQCWGYGTVGAEGVYFVGDNVQPAGRSVADPMRVLFWREADRTIVEVGTMPGIPVCGESGLSISPDDRSLLAVTSSREADIYLMVARN